MKFLKAALAATAMTAFAVSAQAQDSNTYINVGVQSYEFDVYNLAGRVGYNFSENFGVEGEASIGVSSKDGAKIKNSFGGYLVGRVPVSDQLDLFARAGYVSLNFSCDDCEGLSANDDGFAVGGGIQYNLDDQNGVRLGYTYNEGDVASGDVFDIAYVRKF